MMRKVTALLIGFIVASVCLTLTLSAYQNAPELSATAIIVEEKLAEKMPEWRRSSVTPIEGSQNVLISQWESNGQVVRVSILIHRSHQQAGEVIKKFKSRFVTAERARKNNKQKILKGEETDLGDEGFSWRDFNFYGTAFKKGKYTVYVNLIKPNVEETTLTKEFSRHVADALP